MRSFIFNRKSAIFFFATAAAASSTLFTPTMSFSTTSPMSFTVDEKFFFSPLRANDLLLLRTTPSSIATQNFVFAGYHGTTSSGSLCKALISESENIFKIAEETTSTPAASRKDTVWQSGGELGEKGIYIATELNSAFLYGASAATASTSANITIPQENEDPKVVVFEVFYDSSQQWNEPPTVVKSAETFEKVPENLQLPPHDVLVVQNDGNNLSADLDPKTRNLELRQLKETDGAMHLKSLLPTQFKVNPHKLSSLRFVVKSIAQNADEAWLAADSLLETRKELISNKKKNKNKNVASSSSSSSSSSLPILKVMPDGNCMFHSLAWHLKMNSEERGSFMKHLLDQQQQQQHSATGKLFNFLGQRESSLSSSPTSFFGFEEEHMIKTMQLKQELVEWMLHSISQKAAESPVKEKLEEKWNLITSFGEDNAFFGGARTLSQYLTSLQQECDLYFRALKAGDALLKRRASRSSVFGDIQLFFPAISELYPNRPVIVYTDGLIASDEFSSLVTKPLIFSAVVPSSATTFAPSFPIEIIITWGSLHYNSVSFRGPFVTRSKL